SDRHLAAAEPRAAAGGPARALCGRAPPAARQDLKTRHPVHGNRAGSRRARRARRRVGGGCRGGGLDVRGLSCRYHARPRGRRRRASGPAASRGSARRSNRRADAGWVPDGPSGRGSAFRGETDVAARPTWKGFLKISLVSIPIKVFPATESSGSLAFHQLHEACRSRIQQKRWCPRCNREVAHTEIVKGYEFEKGRYVVLTEEDFDKVRPPSTRVI